MLARGSSETCAKEDTPRSLSEKGGKGGEERAPCHCQWQPGVCEGTGRSRTNTRRVSDPPTPPDGAPDDQHSPLIHGIRDARMIDFGVFRSPDSGLLNQDHHNGAITNCDSQWGRHNWAGNPRFCQKFWGMESVGHTCQKRGIPRGSHCHGGLDWQGPRRRALRPPLPLGRGSSPRSPRRQEHPRSVTRSPAIFDPSTRRR